MLCQVVQDRDLRIALRQRQHRRGRELRPGQPERATCGTQGFAGGTLKCGASCAFDTSGCYAQRFVDNLNGTISDYATGLMWEKKADLDNSGVICTSAGVCPDPHDADNLYTWSATSLAPDGTAYTVFLAQLNAGGGFATHTDWRLPTRDELQSIVDYADTSNPVVNAVFDTSCSGSCTVTTCSCTMAYGYESSSTLAPNSSLAWIVFFNIGDVGNGFKSSNYYVRAVRSGL